MMTTDLDYWIYSSKDLEDAKLFYNEIKYSSIKYFMYSISETIPGKAWGGEVAKTEIIELDRGISLDELTNIVVVKLDKFSALHSIKYEPSRLYHNYSDYMLSEPKWTEISRTFTPQTLRIKGIMRGTKE